MSSISSLNIRSLNPTTCTFSLQNFAQDPGDALNTDACVPIDKSHPELIRIVLENQNGYRKTTLYYVTEEYVREMVNQQYSHKIKQVAEENKKCREKPWWKKIFCSEVSYDKFIKKIRYRLKTMQQLLLKYLDRSKYLSEEKNKLAFAQWLVRKNKDGYLIGENDLQRFNDKNWDCLSQLPYRPY